MYFGIGSASISFVFSFGNEVVETFLKTRKEKKKTQKKIVLLVRTKHNSIENSISKSNEISRNQFERILIN